MRVLKACIHRHGAVWFKTRPRRYVRVVAADDRRQIFQTFPPTGIVTMHEAEEALEDTRKLKKKSDCVAVCYMRGIDYDRLITYYHVVERLNRVFCSAHATEEHLKPAQPQPRFLAGLLFVLCAALSTPALEDL